MFKAELIVRPRSGVRDPQADAVGEALRGIDHDNLEVECVGRYLTMKLDTSDEDTAKKQIDDMCRRLLVNPNLETYQVTLTKT